MLILGSHIRVRTPYRVFIFNPRVHKSIVGQVRTRARLFCSESTKKPVKKKSKKITTSIDLDSLPQGVIPLEPLLLEENVPSYPRVVQQARTNMQKYENCVLLTRVGGFYELYFEQAEEIGPLLNLKVGIKKTNAGPVSMAGFPFFQLDRYLKILVQDLSRYVAVAEEFANDTMGKLKAGGLMHDRRVTRVITTGTLIDEEFMDPFSNSYILAIHYDKPSHDTQIPTETTPDKFIRSSVGLAWLDLSTGHFFTQQTNLVALPSVIARISPREIVLNENILENKDNEILNILADESYVISYTKLSAIKPIVEWTPMLESAVPARSIKHFTLDEVSAGSFLLQYVETRLQGSNTKILPPMRQLDLMSIDMNTIRALEIRKTLTDSVVGSLLHTIRHTVTKGGARLLDRWLGSPSTSLDTINSRLDLVAHLIEHEALRQKIIMHLSQTHDTHRLVQKFVFGRGDPDDLLALASTIDSTFDLLDTLQSSADNSSIQSMIQRIKVDGPKALAKRIGTAIDEEGVIIQQRCIEENTNAMRALAEAVMTAEESNEEENNISMSPITDRNNSPNSYTPKISKRIKKKPKSIREHYCDNGGAWIMRPEASPTLKRLHEELSQLTQEKENLEKDLCERLGATSLTLRFTPGLGHICHVKGKDVDIALQHVRNVGSSKSTRSFHHQEWTILGHKMDQCLNHMRIEEQRVFQSLRELVTKNIVKLRRNAAVLDEIDVACSSATIAIERSWSRPILNLGTKHKIISGRHPTVERGLQIEGRSFVTNDCFVGDPHRTWLITGPNMGGKSTFLRQNALITVLAQIGSYVPASYAEIGIVDYIFSRVGSADNLYKDQSTFMLEMLETGQILKQATSKSFVIMDEIGRGTTPEDGEAIAWACLWHLDRINKSRTLFATHFHGLTDRTLDAGLKTIGLWCTDVEVYEDSGQIDAFRYVHKLKEGVNRRSHALKVARLAGLPKEVLLIAEKILGERKESDQEF
ncbi:MutS protein-like protein 1 [Golovinomyces cichoracearum]|uniref:MutS protein-like protein 1 n=1 Tax=Golovinomyces cichoracearum TaxID=62708 RepID=A0A420HKF3_9PEZI|nr:MutS protein-like protein 1 [Golovinomyces cichoracearum]